MMKRTLMAFFAVFAISILSVKAMSYEEARRQALFLTDKMAYELNLTDDQYEAAYEINFDYLLSVDDYDDLYGIYWRRRNMDLSYILSTIQYNTYCAANYFYRPLYYDAGYWRFRVYKRYPRRDYFYFSRPSFYTEYRGGHSWERNGGRSWYSGRVFGRGNIGLRDHWNQRNVDYGRNYNYRSTPSRSYNNSRNYNSTPSPHFGGSRSSDFYNQRSSTRGNVSVPNDRNNSTPRSFGGARSIEQHPDVTTRSNNNVNIPSRTFSSPQQNNSSLGDNNRGQSSGDRRFGGRR